MIENIIEMRTYSLEAKTYHWLKYFGISQIVISAILISTNNFDSHSSLYNIIRASIEVMLLFSVLIAVILAGIIAHKLNRAVILWLIFTIILPPISLIVLSFKKLYLKPQINPIYRKYEIEYFKAKFKMKMDFNKGKISAEEYKDRKAIILMELELDMNQKIQEKEEKIREDLYKTIVRSSIYPETGEAKIAYEKCPACDSKLSTNDFECPDCGLRLK